MEGSAVKRAAAVALMLILLSGLGGACSAEEKALGADASVAASTTSQLKPLALVSLAGYDKLLEAADYLGKLAGNPELAVGWEVMLKMATQNRGLEGIDGQKPWGAILQVDERELAQGQLRPDRLFTGYGFIPVSSFAEIRKTLELLAVPVKEMGRGVLEVTNRDQKTFFLKNVGSWMFFGPKAEALADVAADPIRLLDGLDRRYDVAIRIYPASIPQPLREKFLEAVNQRAQVDLAQRPEEKDEEYAGRRLGVRWTLNAFTAAVNEMDHITLGLMLDTKTTNAFADLQTVARVGTKTADRFAQWAQLQTAFGGFTLPKATAMAHWTGRYSRQTAGEINESFIGPAEKAGLEAAKRASRSAEAFAEGTPLFKRWVDAIRETIATGRADGAVAAVLDPEGVTVIAGQYVADGDKLEKILSEVAESARRENPEPIFKKNADKCNGVRLHTLSIPIGPGAKNRELIAKLFGESLEIVFGFSDKNAYLALGREPMTALKEAIRKSQGPEPKRDSMIKLAVAAGPLARFVSNIVGNHEQSQKAAQLAELLEQGGGKGRIQLTAGPVAGGARFRFEVEEGVLKAAAKLRSEKGQ